MAIDPSTAAQAYSNAVKQGASGAQQGGETGGPSFAELVQQGMEQAMQTAETAEDTSKAAIAGEANLTEVVTAMSNAEVTLDTVTKVRSELIKAYNDIKNMPL